MSDPGRVWRFGYGSNMSLENLITKKNLRPTRHAVGAIAGWRLSFDLAGIPHVEPAFACVREAAGDEVHGLAFEISAEEAAELDAQEAGYDVRSVPFAGYEGTRIEVGIYAPRGAPPAGAAALRPSVRYLRLLQRGAREAGLAAHYIARLDKIDAYVTPAEVRAHTLASVGDFASDASRRDTVWSAAELARYDGSDATRPAHTALLGYVVRGTAGFRAWRGHTITRRNLVHFRGMSVDMHDIRFGADGFLPLPRVADCTAEEREYLWQNLDGLLQGGGQIVGRLREYIDVNGIDG